MPNIKSAKKRVKVTEVKNLRNRIIKSQVKTAFKKFETAVLSGDKQTAQSEYSQAVKAVDMAASKGVVHKNTANRYKSRMAIRLNKA